MSRKTKEFLEFFRCQILSFCAVDGQHSLIGHLFICQLKALLKTGPNCGAYLSAHDGRVIQQRLNNVSTWEVVTAVLLKALLVVLNGGDDPPNYDKLAPVKLVRLIF